MGFNRLEIQLLGKLAVRREGVLAPLPRSRKARALLAYLVVTGRSQSREHLSALLWDGPEDPRASLRWSLSRLRVVVDDSATRLVADREQVAFERAGAGIDLASVREELASGIDRAATDRLERVAGRFRGEFLEGLDLVECYGFHAWCVAEREAARALRVSLIEELVRRLGGEPERALPWARAHVELEPLAGSAQAALVRILGALGRSREAEENYQSFKQMLQARIGERTTVELERARLALRHTASSRIEVATELVPRTSFVGRSRELAVLTAAVDTALSGRGTMVEICGEAGVGKTRLVKELGQQARLRGARVLVGRCLEAEGAPPFLPFLEALDTVLRAEPHPERLAGPDAALAARLLPRIEARLGHPLPAPGDAASERYLVFRAVSRLLASVAAPAGALLVIEDLHWADRPSLALLRYLAAQLADLRLLLVGTYRDEDVERDSPLAEALPDLPRERQRLVLGGLTGDEVGTLVTSLARSPVAPRVIELLESATGGHPFFLEEIFKHLLEEGQLSSQDGRLTLQAEALRIPQGVKQILGRRLARLTAGARRLLAIASATIGALRWDLMCQVSGEDEDRLLEALEELLAAQLLRERVEGGVAHYEASHALVAQTLYEELSLPRRVRLHLQIGEAIERVHAGDLGPHLSALAYHFHQAASEVDRRRAADYAIGAAERASSQLAFEEAAGHYARAIELLSSSGDRVQLSELQVRRGRALVVLSMWSEARAAFEQALDGPVQRSDEWRAEVLIDLARACGWQVDIPAVRVRIEQAVVLIDEQRRPDLAAAAEGQLGFACGAEGDVTRAVQHYERAWALRPDQHVSQLVYAPLKLYWLGRADAIARARHVVATARGANDVVGLLVALPHLALSLAGRGHYGEAMRTFAEARDLAQRLRALQQLSRIISMSAGFRVDLLDLAGAESLAEESVELARSAAWTPAAVSAGIDLAVCRLRRGDLARAERLLDETERSAETIAGFHGWLWRIRLASAWAELALAHDDPAEVERWSAEAIARNGSRRPKYEALALMTRATARTRRGRDAEAIADLREAVALARRLEDPALLHRAGRSLLALDGDAALADETAAAAERIRAELDDETWSRVVSSWR